MNNKEKAKKFFESGFWVAGQGHFNISQDEFALILELLEKENIKELKKLYDKLAQDRLG